MSDDNEIIVVQQQEEEEIESEDHFPFCDDNEQKRRCFIFCNFTNDPQMFTDPEKFVNKLRIVEEYIIDGEIPKKSITANNIVKFEKSQRKKNE
jgi:hypothetical protein